MVDYGNVIQIGGSIILTIAVGFVTCKLKLFPIESISVLNHYLGKMCFLPLMAKSLWQKDLAHMSIMPFVVGTCANVTLHVLIAIIFFLPFKDRFRVYLSTILPTVYVNYLIVGFPIFNAIWPENENFMISVLALSNDPICITIFLLLYNIYKIRKANQEHRLTGEPEEKFSPMVILHILKRLITNPLIIGIIIGFVYAACRFKACPFLDKAFTLLQSCVLALCLFCVGGFLSQHSLISCNWIHFIICALCRHIVFPILIGLYCLAFHVSNRLSRQCIIISCLPSASVSFILESEFDLSPGLASTMIFWTTILCIPFQMLWLFVMDKLNIFPDNT